MPLYPSADSSTVFLEPLLTSRLQPFAVGQWGLESGLAMCQEHHTTEAFLWGIKDDSLLWPHQGSCPESGVLHNPPLCSLQVLLLPSCCVYLSLRQSASSFPGPDYVSCELLVSADHPSLLPFQNSSLTVTTD